jgi:tetratricopeptide (TPR) repeat protein
MHPDLDRFLQNFDTGEPLLQHWALNLMETLAGGPDPAGAQKVVDRLATPEFVASLFAAQDTGLIQRALAALPVESLRPVLPQLETLWETSADDKRHPWRLARVLCDLDPQLAARCFERTIEACQADPGHSEAIMLPQIATALLKLNHPEAPRLARAFIDLYGQVAQAAAEKPLMPDFVLELAWHFDHPEAIAFLESYLGDGRHWEGESPRWRLVPIAYILADAAAELHFACDRIEKTAGAGLCQLAAFYRPETDLEAFEEQMRQVGLRRYGAIAELVGRYLPEVEDPRLARLIQFLADDPALLGRLHKKRQRPYLYGLTLSLLLRSLRRTEIAIDDLTVAGLLDLLAADPITLPHKDAVFSWLREQQPHSPDLKQRLARQLVATDGSLPATPLVELAGHLADGELVAALLSLPAEVFYAEVYLAALETALIAAGAQCFEVADRIWPDLDLGPKLLLLQVAESAPSARARQWVETHFDDLWRLDRERLLTICPLLGVDCRRRLEPLVNKKQPLVDETWLTLSLLSGDRSEAVLATLGAHYAAEKERLEQIGSIVDPEDPMYAMPPVIDAELVCGDCGEAFAYRLSRIWINPDAAGDTYPGEEFQCLGCHRLADFTYTAFGSWQVGGYLMELSMAESPAAIEALLEKGPFEILPREIGFRGEKEIGAALTACHQAIAQAPEEPGLWFELGNIYVNLDHRIKARQCFESVIAMAPDAIEAYLMLAQMAIDKEDYAAAREQLVRGEAQLDKPRMLMSDEISSEDLVLFYRLLQERLAEPDPDLSDIFANAEPPVLKPEKVGRNDPCPCGSGKKYKKCCLNAQT